MTFIILILSAVLLFIWRMRHTYWPTSRLDKTVADVDSLRKLQNEHDIAFHFLGVVESDGDGQWPPKVSYDAWPAALMPYKAIWNDAVPLISDPRNNIYGNQNGYKIKIVRNRLKTLLTTSVALSKVNETLSQATHRNALSQRQYNGFCCCIAFLRHTYRWGTNPIIRSAQRERVIDFPDELALPWRHIQRHFGFTSESGTVMSNFLLNINEHGNPEHVINQPLSQDYRLSEFNFYCMFYEMERLSVPVYYAMIHAIIQFNKGEKSLCRKHMGHLNETFDKVFDSLSGNMHNGKMSTSSILNK
ncbi:hypothetical protein LEL_05674 [Akanthomyces lecanii RCEF 1005]|uniref:Uncharacterized protein n=1 Tax=Akanthomyces lecanii RCEF 1005 TaxID=1081108 RepID=A0A168G3X5_CORDF|nr:hypothetical protein LEL_05674 [Akanthomyces lecanii RCEF 1005]